MLFVHRMNYADHIEFDGMGRLSYSNVRRKMIYDGEKHVYPVINFAYLCYTLAIPGKSAFRLKKVTPDSSSIVARRILFCRPSRPIS